MKTLLSLFDHSGNWSNPYLLAGWKVVRIDIKTGTDILDIDENFLTGIGQVNGILAAPPCTDFAVSGAQYWKAKDADGRTQKSIELVRKTIWIIDFCNPDFWCIENPVGRLSELVPEIGKPKYFNPCDFGDAYTKKTGLWGCFNMPHKTNNIGLFRTEPGELDEVKPTDNFIMKLGGKSEKTKELRSVTPAGFAKAFYLFNH